MSSERTAAQDREDRRGDVEFAFEVLDRAETFVAKIEGPEDYALAPSIATARGEFRREIEWLRESLRISYPATPVDCLLSELRECFDLSADDLISRRQFENRVAEFKKEAAT